MIEVAITIDRRHGQKTARANLTEGDVVIAQLAGYPWPPSVRRQFAIVRDWPDADLSSELLARHQAGETWPALAWPYKQTATVTIEGTNGVTYTRTARRSTRRVDFSKLPPATLADLRDAASDSPKLVGADITTITDEQASDRERRKIAEGL